jgi:hypothetical protein
MATTTPNYGWPVPTSTDLVKDGATAIEALGDAIDATVFAQSSALTLLKSYTFSAVSSLSFDANTFSSTYDNYKILFTATQSATGYIAIRFRAAGTDDSGSNYYYAMAQARTGGTQTLTGGGAANLSVPIRGSSTGGVRATLDVMSPKSASLNKSWLGLSTGTDGTGTHVATSFGTYLSSTSFDSLSFFTETGTMTGTCSVYGYKK